MNYFQLMYMVHGQWTLYAADYVLLSQAETALRDFKRRGFTVRVVDQAGRHVPVKGAMKAPKETCMCGAADPPRPVGEDGLERCLYCGCH